MNKDYTARRGELIVISAATPRHRSAFADGENVLRLYREMLLTHPDRRISNIRLEGDHVVADVNSADDPSIVPEVLRGVDPNDPTLDETTKRLIADECVRNPAYFVNLLLGSNNELTRKFFTVDSLVNMSYQHAANEDPEDRERYYYDLCPEPVQDEQFHSDHKDDHGDRTNKRLRVQPFYHRGRNGKPNKY